MNSSGVSLIEHNPNKICELQFVREFLSSPKGYAMEIRTSKVAQKSYKNEKR